MSTPTPAHPLRRRLNQRFVWPEYEERNSLTNLPATVGDLLNVAGPWRSPPLARQLPATGVRHVVVLLVDGVGQLKLQELMRSEPAFLELMQRYGGAVDGGLPPPMTSVSPATTTAATTVIQADGSAPGALGIVGFTQRLPRLGVVANMLFFQPANDRGAQLGDLERWGVTPEGMRGAPSIYQLLAAGGVAGHAFAPASIYRNPLSRLQFEGTRAQGYVDWVDMLTRLGQHLEATAGERGFTYAYLPDFDSLMHRDGVESPSVQRLFGAFVPQLRLLLAGLSPAAREGTLLLVTADHGHMSTPKAQQRFLEDQPQLSRLMGASPAGEPRHAFLYARAGSVQELRDAAADAYGDAFEVITGAEALAAGLYGAPDRLHPEADRRVGDVVLLARGPATLWPDREHAHLLGMHGSLEPEEMLVPLVALRADHPG